MHNANFRTNAKPSIYLINLLSVYVIASLKLELQACCTTDLKFADPVVPRWLTVIAAIGSTMFLWLLFLTWLHNFHKQGEVFTFLFL